MTLSDPSGVNCFLPAQPQLTRLTVFTCFVHVHLMILPIIKDIQSFEWLATCLPRKIMYVFTTALGFHMKTLRGINPKRTQWKNLVSTETRVIESILLLRLPLITEKEKRFSTYLQEVSFKQIMMKRTQGCSRMLKKRQTVFGVLLKFLFPNNKPIVFGCSTSTFIL